MKKNRSLFLGILALALMFGLVLTGCSNPSGSSGGGGDKGKLEDVEDKKASELGFEEEVSANDLLKELSGDKVSSLADFIEAGGKLEVNGEEVDLGTTTIKPTDTVTIVAPKDDDDDDKNDDDDDSDDGESEFTLRDMEVDEALTADELFELGAESGQSPVSSLADFIAAGGELWVKGKKVTSGSQPIQPDDTIKIVMPEGFSEE